MKNKAKKYWLIGGIFVLFIGGLIFVLSQSQAPKKATEVADSYVIKDSNESHATPKTEPSTSTPQVKTQEEIDAEEAADHQEKLDAVNDFLEEYCNYSSIDERNENIKDLLTPEMQKYMSVDVSVPVTMKSESQSIEVYQDEKGTFLGLVKQTIADRPQVQVYKMELKKVEDTYLISKFSSPTAN